LSRARHLRPYIAGVASFLRLLSLNPDGILRFRDKTTVVICPSMKLPAEVGIGPGLRMETCSRWLDSQTCSHSCMPQVQFSTEGAKDFAARYGGKTCAQCGSALTQDDWYKSRLAVLETNTGVPEVLGGVRPSFFSIPENRDPICSACYSAKVRNVLEARLSRRKLGLID